MQKWKSVTLLYFILIAVPLFYSVCGLSGHIYLYCVIDYAIKNVVKQLDDIL